jgi:hypothetical protein
MIGHIALCKDGVRGSVESIIATREQETWEIRQADGTPTIVPVEDVLSFHHPDHPPFPELDEMEMDDWKERAYEEAREDAAIAAAERTR